MARSTNDLVICGPAEFTDYVADNIVRGDVMTVVLKPYPEMKESGVQWIGAIPTHWVIAPNRSAFNRRKTLVGERHQDYRLLSLTKSGVIVRDLTGEKGKFSADAGLYQEVREGDFVFCLFDVPETPRTVGLSRLDGMISGAYTILECSKNPVTARFLEYFYLAMDSRKLLSPLYSGLRNTIPYARFLSAKFPVPPPHEQLLITRYLTHINNRINRFIRAKRRLIELLEEEKRVVVHQAVTRGLDPDARMKDSGVEWLGEVPEGWEVRRLKTLCTMQSGDSITSESIEESGSYPVYGGNGVRGFSEKFTHSGEFALIGRQGALCGNVHLARGEFWASEHAVVATLDHEHDIRWFALLLEAMNLNQYSIAAAQPGLSVERLMNLWAPVPPVAEQARLAENVEQALAACVTAQERTTHQITLLNEYRTRLISDVVTGKLDVREVAAGLPEVGDEVDSGEEEGIEEVDEVLEEEVG